MADRCFSGRSNRRGRLKRLDAAVEVFAHLHAEELVEHHAVEALDEAMGLRRPNLGAVVLEAVMVQEELVVVVFGATELPAL